MSDIHIDSLEYALVRMRRDRPFVIATHASSEVVNLLIRVRSRGVEGKGAIVPNPVTGDTEASSIRFLEAISPSIMGEDMTVSEVHQVMSSVSGSDQAAKCGVDMALHDLMAIDRGLPLCDLLGRRKDSIETSVTLGIMEPPDALAVAKRWVERGFNILKIKTGLDLERDVLLLEELRDRFDEVVLRVDCNQGYSVEEAISFLERVRPLGVQFVEQPVAADDLDGMREVALSTPIPIMADEAVRSASDIGKLASVGGVGMVNIKLAKSGGIHPALHLARCCEDRGMKAMVGCMSECQASISAGLHFALSQRCVHFADLDSHLSLVDDPTYAVVTRRGVIHPGTGPGLGISFSSEKVEGAPSSIRWKAIR